MNPTTSPPPAPHPPFASAARQIAKAAAFVALGFGSVAHAAGIRLEDDRGTTPR